VGAGSGGEAQHLSLLWLAPLVKLKALWPFPEAVVAFSFFTAPSGVFFESPKKAAFPGHYILI